MKKLMFFCVLMSIYGVTLSSEKARIIEGLEKNAQEGSFAATILLVEDAYKLKKLDSWFQEHGNLWQKLQKVDELSFAAQWLDESCCEALEKIKNNADRAWVQKLIPSKPYEFLAKKLWICQKLGICLHNSEKAKCSQIKKEVAALRALADQDADSQFREDIGNLTNHVYAHFLNPEKNNEGKKRIMELQKNYDKTRNVLAERREHVTTLQQKILKLQQFQSAISAFEALVHNWETC